MSQQNELLPPRLGELFCSARQKQSLTTEYVAQQLRLAESVIEKMEQDQWEDIAPAYRRGYARNYSRLLGLKDKVTGPLINAIGTAETELPPVFESTPSQERMDKTLRWVTYAAASLFLVGPLVYFMTDKIVKFSQKEPLVGAGTSISEQVPAGTEAESSTHLQANVVPLPVTSPPPAERNDPTENLELYQNDRSADSKGTDEVGSPPDTSTLSVVSLELTGDSWIHLSDDEGNRLEYNLLRRGHQASYEGKPPFRILIGNMSAVNLKLDGITMDLSEFSSGNVATLELQPGNQPSEQH